MSGEPQFLTIHDSDSEISEMSIGGSPHTTRQEDGVTVVEPVPCPTTPLRPMALGPQMQQTLQAQPVQDGLHRCQRLSSSRWRRSCRRRPVRF